MSYIHNIDVSFPKASRHDDAVEATASRVLTSDWRKCKSLYSTVPAENLMVKPPSLENCLEKRQTLLDPIAQPPFVSDPGRWWFQIVDVSNVALPLKDREAWAPGRVDPESAKRYRGQDVDFDVDSFDDGLEDEEEDENEEFASRGQTNPSRRSGHRRTLRLTLLELNPRDIEPPPLESSYLVAYELPEIPQLNEFADHLRSLKRTEYLRLRGNLGKILLEGPLDISFNRVILLKQDNVKLCIPMKLHGPSDIVSLTSSQGVTPRENESLGEPAGSLSPPSPGNKESLAKAEQIATEWDKYLEEGINDVAKDEPAKEEMTPGVQSDDYLDAFLGSSQQDSATARSPIFVSMFSRLWSKKKT
eukprot:Gregarina_sp_Pseudo_9__4821@NODE_503_length_2687_cov_25_554003_g474_i0_p1_GENE_NODE_503_length_2687_cov_25_554003_g474_i0NODE_503_length_2687_cov_25_554003_g474_i0_p1_ORF_typecomplete_len361_score32_78RMI1_N/PF08585_12/2_5e05PBP1_TM/PF14812_6/0_068PBP1_TM/PF14812_6/8_6e03Toxin_4/PF00706_17/0_2_NODE_503_length_2687_cov_25_554003_g474_i02591341